MYGCKLPLINYITCTMILRKTLDEGKEVRVVFLHINKAFDKV